MKNLTLLLCLVASVQLCGQDLGIGTTWTYATSSNNPYPGMPEFLTVTAYRDTLLGGQRYLVLDLSPEQAIRVEGDQWYIYEDGVGEHLLYDFSLTAGEVLAIKNLVPGAMTDSIHFRITGIDSIMLDGETFRRQFVERVEDTEVDWGFAHIEHIGSDQFILPLGGTFSPQPGPVKCVQYSDGPELKLVDEPCETYYHLNWPVGSTWIYQPWGMTGQEPTVEFALRLEGADKVLYRSEDGEPILESRVVIHTTDDKVYWKDESGDLQLLYDFSYDLDIGDTVTYYLPPNANLYDISSSAQEMTPIISPYQYVIVDIDEVIDDQGFQLRRWLVDPSAALVSAEPDSCNLVTTIVEGVGSTSGFMRMNCQQILIGFGPTFRCYSSIDINYKEVQGSCLVSSTEDIPTVDIRIVPNPASGAIEIRCQESISHTELLDVTGRSYPLVRQGPSTYDVSGMPTGVYFLSMQTEQGDRVVRRLVVQE